MSGRADPSDPPDGELEGAAEGTGDRPAVLVVDDDRDLADLYARHLADDYDVRTAYGGEEALQSADDDVDVVLLDRRMPGFSGDEVLEKLDERGFDGGVIMLTAISPDYDLLDMAFDEYLEKPITMPELVESVSRIVALNSGESGPQQLYALLSKKYTLEMRKGAAELDGDDRYQALLRDIQSVRAEVDPSVAKRIDAEASSAAFGARDGEAIGRPDFEAIDREAAESAGSDPDESADRPLARAARELLDHVGQPVFIVDGDRRIVDCNAAFTERFGYERSSLEGEPASTLYAGPADDDGGIEQDDGPGEIVRYRTNDDTVFKARTIVSHVEAQSGDGRWRAALLEPLDPAGEVDSGHVAGDDGAADTSVDLDLLARLLRHEVGNDLNLLGGLLGELGSAVDGTHAEAIDRLERHLSRTETTVEEFSEFLTTAGASPLGDVRPVELRPAIERAVERVRATAPGATFDVGELEPTTVRANDLLDVVIRNLLDNAVKHHDGDEPHVTVEAAVEGDLARIRVTDDGPGIPPGVRAALTEPGEKGPDSGGLGLGLYLTRRLLEAYGGSIRFEDRDAGGTAAVVELEHAP